MERNWGRYIRPQPLYRDRADAGTSLAGHLSQYAEANPLVLAIPRGGVPVAAALAQRLDADLDIVVARKLGAPESRELAIGAVTANGGRFLNEELIRVLAVSPAYLEAVMAREMVEARRREAWLRGSCPASEVENRIAIVVDDGLATGATMRAAVRSVRHRRPSRLVVAVPVGSHEACVALREEADEVICPDQPEPFWAVGVWYERFGQTEDAEVQALLEESYARRHGVGQRAS